MRCSGRVGSPLMHMQASARATRNDAANAEPISHKAPDEMALLYLKFVLSKISQQECTSRMPKRTFQPNRRRRSKTHGFRTRMKTKSGQAVLSRRRAKGRKRVSVKPGFRE